MPTEDAYSSGHLVLSHFGTCMCSNVETNLSCLRTFEFRTPLGTSLFPLNKSDHSVHVSDNEKGDQNDVETAHEESS